MNAMGRIAGCVIQAAVLALALGLQAAAAQSSAGSGAGIQCVERTERPDQIVYACTATPSDIARRYRVVARFSGSHDDTMASLAATFAGGSPVACAPTSKLRTDGEDGDVEVDCDFPLDPAAQPREIAVVVKWTHAQFTGFDATAVKATGPR